MSGHLPVLLEEILSFLPGSENSAGQFLDVTAGGGGHFGAILKARSFWQGECWDRDPLAAQRLHDFINKNSLSIRANFVSQSFGAGISDQKNRKFDYILADLGVSSFQLDDRLRGMSLLSDVPPDFRMNPSKGDSFLHWLRLQRVEQLQLYFEEYGEEPKAARLAEEILKWPDDSFRSARVMAEKIAQVLRYPSPSRIHPATRAFQALRIAINDEVGELRRFLDWAPRVLSPGGRLAVISFHSVEDRIVKNAFKALALDQGFVILTKKPIEAQDRELSENPRSRSAKLRVLEKI
jgi:16S rRNA (cytosine1402-N4)-methyltransferase